MEIRGDSGNADALLNTDPVAAVLDTWAFIFQMAPQASDQPAEFFL